MLSTYQNFASIKIMGFDRHYHLKLSQLHVLIAVAVLADALLPPAGCAFLELLL
jgi:hypothetical protein